MIASFFIYIIEYDNDFLIKLLNECLLAEKFCAHKCDILFLLKVSVEIVKYFKLLVKSGIQNGFYPETILRL